MTTRDKDLTRSNKRVLASRGGKASPKPDANCGGEAMPQRCKNEKLEMNKMKLSEQEDIIDDLFWLAGGSACVFGIFMLILWFFK